MNSTLRRAIGLAGLTAAVLMAQGHSDDRVPFTVDGVTFASRQAFVDTAFCATRRPEPDEIAESERLAVAAIFSKDTRARAANSLLRRFVEGHPGRSYCTVKVPTRMACSLTCSYCTAKATGERFESVHTNDTFAGAASEITPASGTTIRSSSMPAVI